METKKEQPARARNQYYAVDFSIACDETLLQICRELLADTAGDIGFEAFEDTENGLTGYIQIESFQPDLLTQAIADFPILEASISYEAREVAEQNWNETWELAGFDPIIIDGRCIIFDARQQRADSICAHLAPLRIGIEARMAFGTGTHETTRMVVSQLLDLDIKGKRILDCGCGTGILGIAASKLGAAEVVAYDIDEWSVENTQHNARLNGVENLLVFHGNSSVLSHVNGVFDIVVANINRNVLIADMQHFHDVTAPQAVLILSGFFEQDIPLLIAEATKHHFQLISSTTENNWACLTLRYS